MQNDTLFISCLFGKSEAVGFGFVRNQMPNSSKLPVVDDEVDLRRKILGEIEGQQKALRVNLFMAHCNFELFIKDVGYLLREGKDGRLIGV